MARKKKPEEKPLSPLPPPPRAKAQPAKPAAPPVAKPSAPLAAPPFAPLVAPLAAPRSAPVVVPPALPVAPPPPPPPAPVPAPVAPKPTREELVVSIGQQLLGRPNVSQNNGARVYDAQGTVILEHGVDFVHMCLTTDDPAYRAMVEGAVRVEVFAR